MGMISVGANSFEYALDQRQQRRLCDPIDLVEQKKHRSAELLGMLETQAVSRRQYAGGVNHQGQYVNSLHRLSHFGHHLLSERCAGAMYTRRVDQHDLRVRTVYDSEYPVSRGLGPRRHNRHLLAHEAVYECGLPRVGWPKYGDKA